MKVLKSNNILIIEATPYINRIIWQIFLAPFISNMPLIWMQFPQVNLNKRRKNRMKSQTAAAIAVQKNVSSSMFLDTDALINNDSVVVYDERTALWYTRHENCVESQNVSVFTAQESWNTGTSVFSTLMFSSVTLTSQWWCRSYTPEGLTYLVYSQTDSFLL